MEICSNKVRKSFLEIEFHIKPECAINVTLTNGLQRSHGEILVTLKLHRAHKGKLYRKQGNTTQTV